MDKKNFGVSTLPTYMLTLAVTDQATKASIRKISIGISEWNMDLIAMTANHIIAIANGWIKVPSSDVYVPADTTPSEEVVEDTEDLTS